VVDRRLISSLEIFATSAAAAGARSPQPIDGFDLVPHLLKPGAPVRAQHYWRVGPQAAFRAGDWKIHRGRDGRTWQLFNLANDIAEQRDLSTAEPAKLAELKGAWSEFDSKMVEPLWQQGGGRRGAAKAAK
jgi:arylsulfatase A-like enzyme